MWRHRYSRMADETVTANLHEEASNESTCPTGYDKLFSPLVVPRSLFARAAPGAEGLYLSR